MGLLPLVGSLKQVSFAKEPYKRENILQERPMIVRSLLIVATPYICVKAPTRKMTVKVFSWKLICKDTPEYGLVRVLMWVVWD